MGIEIDVGIGKELGWGRAKVEFVVGEGAELRDLMAVWDCDLDSDSRCGLH